MELTSGYELSTSITNILIFIASIYGFIKIKKDKLWKQFFLLVGIDSLLGVIVHGISMSIRLNIILWLILFLFFILTVNTFIVIFLKLERKYIFLLSLILLLILILTFNTDIDFLKVFNFYVVIALIISIYSIFKYNMKNKDYFLLAIAFQFIGGVILLSGFEMGELNYNGIYHIFMTMTMIMFYIGVKKNTSY